MSLIAAETSSAAASGRLEMVSFMAGGHRFAVEAAQVRTQLSAGQADVLATHVPPVPIEQLLGLSGIDPQNRAPRRILLMKHPAGDYAVTVSDPVELHSLEISAIHPLPSLIAARSTLTGLRGLAMGATGLTVLVDAGDFGDFSDFGAAKASAK